MTGARLERADLRNADLTGAQLQKAFLVEANLASSILREAALSGADLAAANLSGVNFEEAGLDAADLSGANLFQASFRNADLTLTRFRWSELNSTIFNGAILDGTLISDCNLSLALGLDDCEHYGPSVIDHLTLEQSGTLPILFLKGIGLPDDLIALLPNVFAKQNDYHSCFISYSNLDQKFAARLHRNLQEAGIRCWFAPHDMPIGGKILDEITEAIRRRDKVILILSERSLASDWVEDEVTKAFEEERVRKTTVLCPVRLDDSVMTSQEAWAAKLRGRHIGDFRRWKSEKLFAEEFGKLKQTLKRR